MLLTSNVHEREFEASPEELGAILETAASTNDKVWPKGWPPIRFEGPMREGARGGHGPIRYWVSHYEPTRRVEFTFEPAMGIEGTHAFDVLPSARAGRTVLRHTVIAHPTTLTMRLAWPLAIRWLHDACVEDIFDNVQRALGQSLEKPNQKSLYVRAMRVAL